MPLINKPFVFMRHGETQANQKSIFCGATDIPLNTAGKQQAIDAQIKIAALKIDGATVISSPMLRAVETTELALPDTTFTTDPDLSERNWGDLEMQPIIKQVCYLETPPGGESWEAFITRVTRAINRILSTHDNPLIVAHSGVYRAIQFHLTGTPSGPRIPNATPIRFCPDSQGWKQQIIDEQTNQRGTDK